MGKKKERNRTGTEDWEERDCRPETQGGARDMSSGEAADPTTGGGLFRAIADQASDAIIVIDEKGAVVYLNRAGEKLLGYDLPEVRGHPLHGLLIPERYRENASTAFEALASGHRDGVMDGTREFSALRKNGTEFPLEVSISSCTLEGHTYLFAICRDMSERKRLEKELHGYRAHLERLVKSRTQRLREIAEHYRSLVETSPDCIVLTDLGGDILMINRSGLRLFGYDRPEEMLGRNVLEFFTPEERARARTSMRTRVEGELVRSEGYEMVRRDGTRFHAEISASLLRDAEGKPVGFVSVTRDSSERKRAEERLKKINRCFLELGPDPLDNMRRLTLTAREVLEADLARYTRLLDGRAFSFSSLHPEAGFAALEDPESHLCSALTATGTSDTLSTFDIKGDVFERDPDVREYGMRSCLLHPVQAHGKTVGCLTVMCKAERGFSSLEKDTMAALSRVLGTEEERFAYEESLRDFVDVASHELRHPVALLSGFAETLAESVEEMDNTTRAEVVGAIRQASRRLTALTRSLLDVSLAERNRFVVQKSTGDLATLVKSTAEEVEASAPGAPIVTRIDPALGPLSFDEDRIRNLLVILLENARKYSPAGSEVEVSVEAADEGAMVSVMDRGVGIAEEHRERVFERFYQVEEAQHHSKPGLGLGLFLAKRIVEEHGGRIWHEPRPGGGSIFRFVI
ncbi:MAG: PAS domain S-box protein [Actinobacteria bacterium]|nr:PAS domain S-box protein [Actinomycetota bacterium]